MENQVHFRGNSAYWNSFKWGTIFPSESTFKLVARSKKNVFKLFGDGLGINSELLHILKDIGIRYIEVPYCDEILITKTEKWIRGIPSRYSSDRVDRQTILKLCDITLEDTETLQTSNTVKQLSLFHQRV